MPQTKQPSFSCAACGRKYPWKPELAGKRCKCKCGQVITAPAQAQAAPAAAPAPQPAPLSECPNCASPLDDGAIVCISCGYNLQTGAMMGTEFETPLPAPPPTPSPAGRSAAATAAPAKAKSKSNPRSRGRGEQEEGTNLKPFILGGIAVILLIGAIAGAKFYLKGSRNAVPDGPSLGQDATARDMLRDQNPMEAKEYLNANDAYSLGTQWTKRQAMARVDQWYGMGAKKIYAFAGVICKTVVVELPPTTEPDKRKQLFDWVEEWDKEHMRQIQKDVGQKYLLIEMT